MAVTPASFKAQFPEFTNADNALVQSFLDSAALRCPVSRWADLVDEGVKWTAAQLLAQSPSARSMELQPDGSTVYDDELRRLKRIVASGGRVI